MTAYTDDEIFIPAGTVEANINKGDVLDHFFVQSAITPGQAVSIVGSTEDQVAPTDTGSSLGQLVGVALDNLHMNTSTGKAYGRLIAYPTGVKCRVATSGEVIMVAGAAGCTLGSNVVITTAAGVVVDAAGTTGDLGITVGRALNTAASGESVRVRIALG